MDRSASSTSSSASPASGALLVEHAAYGLPGVVRVTLHRPDAFHALSEQVIDELQATLSSIAQSDERVVVLAAHGRAYCAGHDLKELRATPSLEFYQRLFSRCSSLMRCTSSSKLKS